MKRSCRVVHHFVVHGSTEERMRMANDRYELRVGSRDGPEKRLKASGGPVEEEAAVENVRHQRQAPADGACSPQGQAGRGTWLE
jgi:hypothetical protein